MYESAGVRRALRRKTLKGDSDVCVPLVRTYGHGAGLKTSVTRAPTA